MGQLTNQYVSSSYQGLLKMTDSTTGVTGTLQTVQTGDGTNTPLQISQTEVNISGSLTINGSPVSNVNTGSFVTTSSFNAYTSSMDTRVDGIEAKTGSYATTGSNVFIGDQTITGSLFSSDIIGTGSLFLQPNQGDARFVEVYNTSPTDTHITASGGQIFLGDDQTYVKVDNYGSVERIDVVAGNELVVSSSIVNLTGSLHQSGTFYPDVIDWISSSIVQNTGSYILTTNLSGVTQYDSYQNVASALQPFINTGSLPSGLVSGSSQISYTGITDVPSGIVSGSSQISGLGFATTGSVDALTGSINSLNSATSSYINTGSVGGNQSITGSLGISGTLTALSASITYLETIYETASVIYSSGSNQFGDASNDTQTLWGTVKLPSGPLSVTGSVIATNFTGSLQGTASYAINALSASYAPSVSIDTGSFATTGSNVFIGDQTISGSINLTGSINNVQYIDFNTASVVPAWKSGRVFWDNTDSCLAVYNAEADITLQVGQEQWVRVRNNTGVPIVNGAVVRLVGAQGDNPLVVLAQSEQISGSLTNTNQILGVATHTIEDGTDGYVTTLGNVRGLNTSAFNEGDVLWVSSSAGLLTNVIPVAPYERIPVATVIKDGPGGSGIIYVAPIPPIDFPSLSSVEISGSYSAGDLWNYQGGVWKHRQPLEIGLTTTSSLTTLSSSIAVTDLAQDGRLNSIESKTGSYITTGSAASVQSITGSLIISGSNGIELDVKGDQLNTGSLSIRSGSLSTFSQGTTVNTDLYLTNSLGGQSNIIKGWGDNPGAGGAGAVQSNYTGSLRITGSNNTVSLPQLRSTGLGGGADLQGYISGSDNTLMSNNSGIYLNTGSLLFPKTTNNYLGAGSSILMNFTTSSLAGGHPLIQNNTLYAGQIAINSNSGSLAAAGNLINGGSITSTQNFVTNVRPSIGQNIVNGVGVTLNHISSSINYSSNINNSPVTINNHLSSSNITNNSLTFTNNTILGGSSATGLSLWVSGSQNSNATRTISDNLIGGKNIIVSSSFVSSSTSNLVSSLIYGQNLIVSGNHASTVGGSTFVGRYNDATSLHLAQDVVFAVGTGTGTSTRRTGLYVTSGSLVGVSGSLSVVGNSALTGNNTFNGDTTMSSSTTFPLTVDGTINSKRLHFTSNPFNSNPASNLGAIRFDGTNQTFYSTNYDLAQITTQSQVFQTVVTGSGLVETGLRSNNMGSDYNLILTNQSGTGSLTTNANVIVTGLLTVNGSVQITGSVQGNVLPLTVTSNTASLNLNNGNFFVLALTGSQNIRIEPSNIKPGQTINLKLNTTGSGTVSFPTSVLQQSGSAYVPTTTVGTDIITMVSFDSTNLYLANVKNLI